jgi:hypothetical protein
MKRQTKQKRETKKRERDEDEDDLALRTTKTTREDRDKRYKKRDAMLSRKELEQKLSKFETIELEKELKKWNEQEIPGAQAYINQMRHDLRYRISLANSNKLKLDFDEIFLSFFRTTRYHLNKLNDSDKLELIRELLEFVDPTIHDILPLVKNAQILQLLLEWRGPNGKFVDPTMKNNELINEASMGIGASSEIVRVLLEWRGPNGEFVDPRDALRYARDPEIFRLLLGWRGPNGEFVSPLLENNFLIQHRYNPEVVRILLNWVGPNKQLWVNPTAADSQALVNAATPDRDDVDDLDDRLTTLKMLLDWVGPNGERVDPSKNNNQAIKEAYEEEIVEFLLQWYLQSGHEQEFEEIRNLPLVQRILLRQRTMGLRNIAHLWNPYDAEQRLTRGEQNTLKNIFTKFGQEYRRAGGGKHRGGKHRVGDKNKTRDSKKYNFLKQSSQKGGKNNYCKYCKLKKRRSHRK